jgi:hypothetical protein
MSVNESKENQFKAGGVNTVLPKIEKLECIIPQHIEGMKAGQTMLPSGRLSFEENPGSRRHLFESAQRNALNPFAAVRSQRILGPKPEGNSGVLKKIIAGTHDPCQSCRNHREPN